MRYKISEVAFITANDSKLSIEENLDRFVEMKIIFDNLKVHYTIVQSYHNQVKEHSLMLFLNTGFGVKHEDRIKTILEIARKFDQDHILYRNNRKLGHLIYTNEKLAGKFIGKIDKVTKDKVKDLEYYTYFPHSKSYFGIVSKSKS